MMNTYIITELGNVEIFSERRKICLAPLELDTVRELAQEAKIVSQESIGRAMTIGNALDVALGTAEKRATGIILDLDTRLLLARYNWSSVACWPSNVSANDIDWWLITVA
jgi:hypothetical protein